MTTLRVVIAAVLAVGAPSGGIAVAAAGGTGCIEPENGRGCLPVAPDGDRVDLVTPSFTNPTAITNPLHPSGRVASALMLGRVDRLPFRTEVTLLPETKAIELSGRRVETLISQYVAFLDGRIHEVALDWYAHADDGPSGTSGRTSSTTTGEAPSRTPTAPGSPGETDRRR